MCKQYIHVLAQYTVRLNINIFLSWIFLLQDITDPGKIYPVMLFMPGGAYIAGTAQTYDLSYLASFGPVVAVSFNYRLAALGT